MRKWLSVPWRHSEPDQGSDQVAYALSQRRISSNVDHLRPQRWNWYALVYPLDRAVERQAAKPLETQQVRGLRYFWLDGIFATISENFYIGFVTLFALAYGASNGQVGWLTAVANLMGAIALFPGAQVLERFEKRKPVVVWTGGGFARLMLLGLAFVPFFLLDAQWAILAIILLNGVRAFMGNFANPAWTSIVADLVPTSMRGRYFGSRNLTMGVAALVVAPLAGWLIRLGNGWQGMEHFGYQLIFLLAFATGMISTLSFNRIPEPDSPVSRPKGQPGGEIFQVLRDSPGFLGLVASSFVWNLAIQIAGPFFNVYLVNEFGTSAATIGLLAAVSSASALFGQMYFGRAMDRKGALWVQIVSGLAIPILPFFWLFVTAPWQVTLINLWGGFMWAGYGLSNFSLLLELTPDEQRPRAVALYQTSVFAAAVLGPLMGGYLADVVGYHLIFILSGVGRLIGIIGFILLSAGPARRSGKGIPADVV
ncbi:MAG: MFS transporter [Caldilineaceae bacterium]